MRSWPAPALPSSWTNTGAPPFVARREELRALHEAFSAVEAGAGRAIFLSGDPGAGKSRLLATIGSALHDLGAAVLYGDCIQELGRPLEPVDQALEPLLSALGSGEDGGIPAEALAVVRDTFTARERETAPAIGQDRLFASIADVLTAASVMRPIVLALDDMHWAAEDVVRLLRRLVVGIADSRIFVLVALRPDPPDRSEPLTDLISQLTHLPGVERMTLPPFSPADLTEFLELGAGLPADEARGAALALVEVTGGNPFLVRTTWRQVLDAVGARDRRVDMPESVFEPLRPRIAMLSDAALGVLRVAAVLGHEVDLGELLAVSEATQEYTLVAVDASVRAGLLELPARIGDPYRFPHAIARQAVLDGVPASELMRLHARIAQTLEARFPTAPRLVQRLAYHYVAARALGFGDRAVEYLVRSAESADLRLAHEQAGGLFERAADLAADPGQRDDLRRRSARSWALASDFSRERELHERMMESRDPRVRLRAAIGYEDGSWREGLDGTRGMELLSAALDAVPADEHDPLFVEGLGSLGRAIAFTGDPAKGAMISDRAIVLARELGDERTLAATLRTRIWQSLRPEGLWERIAEADEMEPLTTGMSEDWAGLTGIVRAFAGYVVGDPAVMERGQSRLTANSKRWGAYWTFWAESARFGRAFADGRLEDAKRILGEIGTIEQGFRGDLTPGSYAVQEFMVRRETGRLGIAASVVTGDESPTSTWAPGLLALYTELGMEEPCSRTLHWLLERDGEKIRLSADWPGRLAFMAEAALALGDTDAASVLLDHLEEYSGCNLVSGFFVAQFGPADMYLGRLNALCGAGDPSADFDRAIRLAEEFHAPLHVAYACAAAGAFARREGDTVEARAFTERARALAEPLGLVRVLRGLPEASAAPSIGGLTPREIEVLRLLAEGLSNREIASELVISEHTAANHVRSILTKVGVPNRTRAARFAREQGLA
ncbi:ATP-binding protein [Agromyces sp. NPDC004153]